LNRMIYDLMGVIAFQPIVGRQSIRVESRTRRDVLIDFGLQRMFLAVRNDRSTNLSATFQDAHDGGFVFGTRSGDSASPFAYVHIPSLTADERLIYFDFAAEFRPEEIILQSKPKTLQHEPCRLLSYTDGAMNLHAADAVLAVDQHPESGHPLIQSNGRVLHYRADLHGELLLAHVAEPNPTCLEKRVFSFATARTGDMPVWPAAGNSIVKGSPGVGKVGNRFLEGFQKLLSHEEILH
jgi:hypothetical protein